jgi:hypothetical protein
LGLINIQESFHTIPVFDFSVSVYSETSPKEVLGLPDKKPIPFVYENNLIRIHIADLHIYSMIFIQY